MEEIASPNMFPRLQSSSVFTADRRELLWDTFIFGVRFYPGIISAQTRSSYHRQKFKKKDRMQRHCMDDLISDIKGFFSFTK